MKKIVYFILFYFILFSCKSKKNDFIKISKQQINTNLEKELSENEKKIIDDFIEILLKDNRYKSLPIYIVKETGNLGSLIIYEYCYNERNLPIKNSINKDWILNETEIQKLKKDSNNKEKYNWKVSDFSINVSILEQSELLKTFKDGTYIELPERLFLYLSTPLIIDKNYSFMSFRTVGSKSGKTIDSYTALLKKNSEGKWEIDSKYYDPNYIE